MSFGGSKAKSDRIPVLYFLILPLSFWALWNWLKNERGAYYRLADPDYAYLLNSLNIVNGFAPAHVDHPGTSVQQLGALIIKLTLLLSGRTDATSAVLSNPEIYLLWINIALVGMSSLIMLVGAFFVYKTTSSVMSALAVQLSFICAPPLVLSIIRVTPEQLIVLMAVMSVVLLFSIRNHVNSNLVSIGTGLLLGIFTGIGVASKVTFVPLVVVPLIVLPRVLPRIMYAGASLVSFYLCTIPIHHHLLYVWQWLKSIFFHQGRYGHGPTGIVDIDSFVSNVMSILQSELLMTFTLCVAIVYFIFTMVYRQKGYFRGYWLKLMIAMVVAMCIQIIMVGKHPGDNRYLIPGLALSPFILSALCLHLESLNIEFSGRYKKLAAIVVLSVMCIPLVKFNYSSYLSSQATHGPVSSALLNFADYWSGKRYTQQIQLIYKL